MRSVDTNVLIRVLARDDPDQAAAAETFISSGAWISHLVLVEATWVLTAVYDRSPSALSAAIDRLLDHQYFVLQDPDVVRAALEVFRKRPSLGFSDCLLLEVARKAGHLPLGSFDRALARLDGAERVID
jgi:predicted nucleic-acid-binding protein